ncbi:uncharacterized protein DNG_06472 [Cephalotrichum gorgonifer]|uniref:BZIP domain-containing protein n=1 Tax=Cephalotrichum gorgonifer TaxID=2041049 RepID=A0AAE8N1Q1_9PEZI|nr:uncharacterized protein DNG_06472 [Cephalotrichum gorgonifer]
MASRRSGLHSLLNSTDPLSGPTLGSESAASPSGSSDFILTPRSRSNSSMASASPQRHRTPTPPRAEAFHHSDHMHVDSSPQAAGHRDAYRGQFAPSGAPSHRLTSTAPPPPHHGFRHPPAAYHEGSGPLSVHTSSQPTHNSYQPFPNGNHHVALPAIDSIHQPRTPEGHHAPPLSMHSLANSVGDGILVSVDTYSASKEAGGKRQKNADASARYRRRKADQAAEEKSRILELQEEARYLGGRVIELTRQKEFYRSERQILRELMAGVPALEDAARNRPRTPELSL